MPKEFYGVNEVIQITGVSKSKAYEIVRKLRNDYKKEYPNCITIQARIPVWYFEEKVLGRKNKQEVKA